MENTQKKSPAMFWQKNKKTIIRALISLVVLVAIGAFIYLKFIPKTIYIEKSQISADQIDLSVKVPGVLQETMVNPGDIVSENTIVAKVGDQLIKTTSGGEIIAVHNDIGKIFNPGEVIISMIDRNELRVVGQIQETKGLSKIKIGQKVLFKVDAFGGKKYYGIVDEISPTSHDTGIAFNISDKRETKEFDIKVRFNIDAYPELSNGMSAKIWVYEN